MASSEMDSFVTKFKTLCQAGRNASLTLSSNAGKAVMNLRVDLGVLEHQDRRHHHPPQRSRNGPAQQRRRERRAAARQASTEQAEAILSLEEREVLEAAEKAEAHAVAEEASAKASAEQIPENVNKVCAEIAATSDTEKIVDEAEKTSTPVKVVDEFCSNASYSEERSTQTDAYTVPPSSRRLGGFDYYSLRYEDPSDSD